MVGLRWRTLIWWSVSEVGDFMLLLLVLSWVMERRACRKGSECGEWKVKGDGGGDGAVVVVGRDGFRGGVIGVMLGCDQTDFLCFCGFVLCDRSSLGWKQIAIKAKSSSHP